MPFEGEDIELSDSARRELEEIGRSQALPAGFVLRAKIVLLLAEGLSYEAIQSKLDTTAPTISRWKKRFLESGLDGFETQRPGQPPQKLTAKLRGKILEATRRPPRDGSTHWSCRKLASELGISKDLVHRVWREAGLKPHRLERYMASDDPDFESKAADIIGLYLNPPQHAAVFCVDEKTAIQALDRRDRVLPLSPGRAERHGFEYKRNGTLSLYAALNTKTGQVQGRTAARHTSQEFVGFLEDVVEGCAPDQEIHLICDCISEGWGALIAGYQFISEFFDFRFQIFESGLLVASFESFYALIHVRLPPPKQAVNQGGQLPSRRKYRYISPKAAGHFAVVGAQSRSAIAQGNGCHS